MLDQSGSISAEKNSPTPEAEKTQQELLQEALKSALRYRPEILNRLETIKFAPLSVAALTQIAGVMAGKELGDGKLSKEQRDGLGTIIMEIVTQRTDYDPDKGARGMQDTLKKALAGPLDLETEIKICAHSPNYASRVSYRQGEQLAEAFQKGIAVKPMKNLRLKSPKGVTP